MYLIKKIKDREIKAIVTGHQVFLRISRSKVEVIGNKISIII